MKTMLVVVFIANVAVLVVAIWIYIAHRISGKPRPWHHAGNVTRSLGTLLMLAAVSARFDEEVATVLLIFALLLTIWSTVIFVRARRHVRRAGR
jgi:hypothetical protein